LRKPTFEAMVKQSASTKTNIYDIYNASGAIAGERRWRIQATGSAVGGSNRSLTLDHRVRFTGIPLAERDGETTYSVGGELVYDSSNASDLKAVAVNNQVALATWT